MWRTAAGEILANTMVHILYSLYSYCQESKKKLQECNVFTVGNHVQGINVQGRASKLSAETL